MPAFPSACREAASKGGGGPTEMWCCGGDPHNDSQFIVSNRASTTTTYEDFEETPRVIADESSTFFAQDINGRISRLIKQVPTDVARDTATVNFTGVTRRQSSTAGGLASQHDTFRRVSSLQPAAVPENRLVASPSRKELELTITLEKQRDHESWEPDLLSEEGRLQKRLDRLKLDMHVVAGDGNCQFRSVSFNLFGTQDYHKVVRKKAVDQMRLNNSDFKAFLGDDWKHYLKDMEKQGTWGDELTLRALCDYFGIVINVITSDQHNWFLRYKPKRLQQYPGGQIELFLTYIAPYHYNAVRRRTSSLLKRSMSRRTSSRIQEELDRAVRDGTLSHRPSLGPLPPDLPPLNGECRSSSGEAPLQQPPLVQL